MKVLRNMLVGFIVVMALIAFTDMKVFKALLPGLGALIALMIIPALFWLGIILATRKAKRAVKQYAGGQLKIILEKARERWLNGPVTERKYSEDLIEGASPLPDLDLPPLPEL